MDLEKGTQGNRQQMQRGNSFKKLYSKPHVQVHAKSRNELTFFFSLLLKLLLLYHLKRDLIIYLFIYF